MYLSRKHGIIPIVQTEIDSQHGDFTDQRLGQSQCHSLAGATVSVVILGPARLEKNLA